MAGRRSLRVVFGILLAFTLVCVGGPAGAAKSDGTKNQFKNLKPVKEPSPCKNDPGVSGSEIKVGGILPLSGPSAPSFGAAKDGIEARIQKANAEGELGDRKLTFDAVDDQNDAAKNVTAAQQLVEQDNVFGIIEDSPAADASAKYLNGKGVPVAGWHLGLASFGIYPNMFGWRNSQPPDPKTQFTTRNADVLKALGASKIAAVGTNQQSSAVFVQQVASAVKRTKGMKSVLVNVDTPIGSTEFTGLAQRIKDSGADGLYTGMDFIQNVALNGALKQAGVNLKAVIFPGGYDPRVLSNPNLDGAYFGLEFKPFELNTPGYQEFKKWMGDKPVGQVPAVGWLSADAFIEGLKAAGVACPTRKAFIANLRLEKAYDANGFFDPVNFSEEFGRPFRCVYYVKVVNKAFVPQFDGKPFCAKGLITDNKITKLAATASTTVAPTASSTP